MGQQSQEEAPGMRGGGTAGWGAESPRPWALEHLETGCQVIPELTFPFWSPQTQPSESIMAEMLFVICSNPCNLAGAAALGWIFCFCPAPVQPSFLAKQDVPGPHVLGVSQGVCEHQDPGVPEQKSDPKLGQRLPVQEEGAAAFPRVQAGRDPSASIGPSG